MKKLQPINTHIVIEVLPREEETKSGIIIPQNAQKKPVEGKVVCVSAKSVDFSEGDIVMYDQYAGTEIMFDGKDYLIMKEDLIMAKKVMEEKTNEM